MRESVFPRGWGRNFTIVSAVCGAISIAGCECGGDGPGLTRLQAQISVNPQELTFGDVPIGARMKMAVAVENKGTDVLRLCLASSTLPSCDEKTNVDPAGTPFAPIFE